MYVKHGVAQLLVAMLPFLLSVKTEYQKSHKKKASRIQEVNIYIYI